jgi:predicted outer membrane protein
MKIILSASMILGVALSCSAVLAGESTDTGGNGMAQRSRFDIYSRENSASPNTTTTREYRRAETEEAYAKREQDYLDLGNDIRGLRGIQSATTLNELQHLNKKQIDLAKLAESTAKSEAVLNMAHRIRADHEMLQKKVEAVAKKLKITLEPYRLAEPEQVIMDRLKSLQGRQFELAYMRVVDRGHRDVERTLSLVRADLVDPQVRGLMYETLPTLTAHTNMYHENRARARVEEEEIGE